MARGLAPLDLIVTMDDATGAVYSAFLVEEEGTASTFRALKVFAEHGLPMSLDTDHGTIKAGEVHRGVRPGSAGRSRSSAWSTSRLFAAGQRAVGAPAATRFRIDCRRN